jgi:hypothetical protein
MVVVLQNAKITDFWVVAPGTLLIRFDHKSLNSVP